MLVKILEEKIISIKVVEGFKFITNYICEITRKDGSKHNTELRENQLTKLYRDAKNKGIIFEVCLEDEILEIEELSFEEIEENIIDVYTHIYCFSEEADFDAVVSNEKCITLTLRKFNNFKEKNNNRNWA